MPLFSVNPIPAKSGRAIVPLHPPTLIDDPLGYLKVFFATCGYAPAHHFHGSYFSILVKAKFSLRTNFGNPNLRAKINILKRFIHN